MLDCQGQMCYTEEAKEIRREGKDRREGDQERGREGKGESKAHGEETRGKMDGQREGRNEGGRAGGWYCGRVCGRVQYLSIRLKLVLLLRASELKLLSRAFL